MSTDVSEACCLHHQAMMEAARPSETSVGIQLRIWQYIPEDSELHTRRRENLKSQRETSYPQHPIPNSDLCMSKD
jgi:hypothetical protein